MHFKTYSKAIILWISCTESTIFALNYLFLHFVSETKNTLLSADLSWVILLCTLLTILKHDLGVEPVLHENGGRWFQILLDLDIQKATNEQSKKPYALKKWKHPIARRECPNDVSVSIGTILNINFYKT